MIGHVATTLQVQANLLWSRFFWLPYLFFSIILYILKNKPNLDETDIFSSWWKKNAFRIALKLSI